MKNLDATTKKYITTSIVLVSVMITATLVDCSGGAQAQTWGQAELGFEFKRPVGEIDPACKEDCDRRVYPQISGYFSHNFDEMWGITAFLLVTDAWAEALIGPTITPIPELQFGVQVGAEQALSDKGNPVFGLRYGVSIYSSIDFPGMLNLTILALLELNNDTFLGKLDGLWYDLRVLLTPEAATWLSVGVQGRRFMGAGPSVAFAIPETPVGLWTTWTLIDPERDDVFDPAYVMAGLKATFE